MGNTEYTPTTAEIREYVEIGGEPRPWEPPTPEIDAARVAAFDRWLAGVTADAKNEQSAAEMLEVAKGECVRLERANATLLTEVEVLEAQIVRMFTSTTRRWDMRCNDE